jgi:D-alanyl-lipoteichoic acid acyltransferase DltB (MBOAT superfamily)
MTFLGFAFILFFLVVAAAAYALPVRFRNLLLLFAGYYFYWTWQPGGLILIIAATVIDYFLALGMGPVKASTARKRLLVLGIILNVGLLFFFKYFNFFNEFFRSLSAGVRLPYPVPALDIILPLGISYYLFKKISYIVDVYREHIQPERNFIRLALYVSFFPEIIAGPIDRAGDLLPQFVKKIRLDPRMLTEGAQMIAWGLFKKLVIADRMGIMVDSVFDHPGRYQGAVIALAVLFYTFQIYCDFSGYSDIAIGLGRLLGFKLTDNFRQPYFATSVSEFWKRWHISLSTWLRDYLFLPVCYSLMRKLDTFKGLTIKVEAWAYIGGALFTMTLCGLWHGAAWTFVLWGLLHGVYLAVSFITKKARKKVAKFFRIKRFPSLRKAFKISVTFILVSFSWLFFRAHSVGEAFDLIRRMFSLSPTHSAAAGAGTIVETGKIGGLSWANFSIAVAAVVLLLIVEFFQEKKSIHRLLAQPPTWLRWAVYYAVIFSILVFGIYQQQEFIYGQF